MDVVGYYQPDETKVVAALRPSTTFNAILARL
jgi:monomeric isocitrate dehydrogenase